MDKEQAIEKLNDIRCHVKETSAEEQALVMAIDALKAQLFSEGATSDTISRQAARHALCKAVHKGEDIPCENQTASCLWTGTRVCDFVREINALPSVQPEPHEGQWIPHEGYWIKYDKRFPWRHLYKCSECGNYLDFSGINGERGEANYCPNCGAKMKGAKHETD